MRIPFSSKKADHIDDTSLIYQRERAMTLKPAIQSTHPQSKRNDTKKEFLLSQVKDNDLDNLRKFI